MPQASDDLRQRWGGEDGVGDDKAYAHLIKHGFRFVRGVIHPPVGFDWTTDETDCEGAVDFLIDEWDYEYDSHAPARGALEATDRTGMPSEEITAAAIRYRGLVCALPRPARHHHIIRAIGELPGIEIPVDREQGFVTSNGRFVNRSEAMRIALQAKQVKTAPRPWLASEDLW